MKLIHKNSLRLPTNSVKTKIMSLKNKEFKVSVDPISKKHSISPKDRQSPRTKLPKTIKSPKTLISSPIVFSSFNIPESRFTPHHLTPTPSGYFPQHTERRSSVCLKLKINENNGRNSAFGESQLRNDLDLVKSKLGVSELYSVNGNLLFGRTQRTISPNPTPVKVYRGQKGLKKLKKTKSSFNFRKNEVKVPKFAFEVKRIAAQVKSSKKKQLSVV